MAQVIVTGGSALRRFITKARAATAKLNSGARDVSIGWYPTAKYQGGQPVATVAAINEFGLGRGKNGTPRPSIRNSEQAYQRVTVNVLRDHLPDTMSVSTVTAGLIGSKCKSELQAEIKRLGVIDTGHMRQTVTWKVG